MSSTPYTTGITTTLGIDTDALMTLAQTHGTDSPIGQCSAMLMTTVWDMESAEREAAQAVSNLTDQTKQQAASLAGNGRSYDPSWLATYANRAAEAGAKLTAGTERLRTFKRLLDMLTKATANV